MGYDGEDPGGRHVNQHLPAQSIRPRWVHVCVTTILDGTESFGSGTITTVDAPAVDCPSCAATVFTEKIGAVSCDACGEEFHAAGHDTVSCPAVECGQCSKKISFIQEHRSSRGPFETYHCHHWGKDFAIQTANGVGPTETVLEIDWLLDGRCLDDAWNPFGEGHWWTRAETDREQAAVDSLNIEAQCSHPSFRLYNPGSTNAHLCGTDEYCIGYITWEETHAEPELGQLYILPAFRRQGIEAGFVGAWRGDVTDLSSRLRVNNPNAGVYRLLRSIGAIEITEDGLVLRVASLQGRRLMFRMSGGQRCPPERCENPMSSGLPAGMRGFRVHGRRSTRGIQGPPIRASSPGGCIRMSARDHREPPRLQGGGASAATSVDGLERPGDRLEIHLRLRHRNCRGLRQVHHR